MGAFNGIPESWTSKDLDPRDPEESLVTYLEKVVQFQESRISALQQEIGNLKAKLILQEQERLRWKARFEEVRRPLQMEDDDD